MAKTVLLIAIFVLQYVNYAYGQEAICLFHDLGSEYSCELLIASYLNQNDPFNIGGNHMPNFGDHNVTRIQTNPSFPQHLRFIPPQLFQRFPNLQYVELNDVGIQSLAGIQYCGELRSLSVNHNNISSIPTNAFAACSNLREFYAEYNIISQIYVDSFDGAYALETLRLRNNIITNLFTGMFDSLQQLRILDLERNRIQMIPSDLFVMMQNLEQVSFVYNMISRINTRAFNNLPRIYSIDINSNFLSEIEPNAFLGGYSLSRLYLQNNLLTRLNADMFSSVLPDLQILSVQNNGITAIERTFFEKIPNLVYFDMRNNVCAYEEYWPQTDDFFEELELCFQNYDGDSTTTTPIATPPSLPPTTGDNTTPITIPTVPTTTAGGDITSPTSLPPTIPPTVPTTPTPPPTTPEATTEEVTEPITLGGSMVKINVQFSLILLAVGFFLKSFL